MRYNGSQSIIMLPCIDVMKRKSMHAPAFAWNFLSTTKDVDIDVGFDYTSAPSFTLYFCLAFRGAAWTPVSRGWSVSPCWWPACATISTTEAPITHSSKSMVQTFFNELCLVGPGCAADLFLSQYSKWKFEFEIYFSVGSILH